MRENTEFEQEPQNAEQIQIAEGPNALTGLRSGLRGTNPLSFRRLVPPQVRPTNSFISPGGNGADLSQTRIHDGSSSQLPDNELHHGSPVRDSHEPQLGTQQENSGEAASPLSMSAKNTPQHERKAEGENPRMEAEEDHHHKLSSSDTDMSGCDSSSADTEAKNQKSK
ncbi:hypothetical protein R1flu_028226 [Riccia fluitans]|uniref:Uncharacterized protein n=1 Tax=Riccia fluitans TaxID=41844 RepID=A0ABD1XL32_9MARC